MPRSWPTASWQHRPVFHIPLQWPWKGILHCLPQVLVSSPLVSQTAQGLGGCRVLLGTWLSNGDPRELYLSRGTVSTASHAPRTARRHPKVHAWGTDICPAVWWRPGGQETYQGAEPFLAVQPGLSTQVLGGPPCSGGLQGKIRLRRTSGPSQVVVFGWRSCADICPLGV